MSANAAFCRLFAFKVRVENVTDPENHIQGVLDRVQPEHLRRHYNLVSKENAEWTGTEDFLAKIALQSGRLLKGGEPDITTVAKMVLNDFQRGKLPFYALPPGCVPESVIDPSEQAPINEVEEDEKAQVTDAESAINSDASDASGGEEEAEEEAEDEKDEALDDLSGLSDEDDEPADAIEGLSDEEAEEKDESKVAFVIHSSNQ